jgi:hypothetical protein
VDHFIGIVFFSVYGGIMALFGAGYYHFVWRVEKTKRELAEAKEKLAALEKNGGKTADDAVKAA